MLDQPQPPTADEQPPPDDTPTASHAAAGSPDTPKEAPGGRHQPPWGGYGYGPPPPWAAYPPRHPGGFGRFVRHRATQIVAAGLVGLILGGSAGIAPASLATLFSLTSVCTSSSPRSAMVAMAPPSRDAWPATPNGDTVSPTSARFLMTTPSNGARTLVFSSASSVTRTRARADAMAASADFDPRRRHRGRRLGGGQRGVGRDAVLRRARAAVRAFRTSSSRAAIACTSCASASATARRDASSCASMSACSISRDDLALAHARALFERQPRQPAAGLHADVAAVARDDVAGRDEHRQRRSSRRRAATDLRRARDVDFRRPPLGDVRARATDTTAAPAAPAAPADGPRQPAAARRGVAIDAQARKIARRRIGMNCHG